MKSRVCNDISVGHGHQVLRHTLIGELLSQEKSERIFCIITVCLFLMQIPSSKKRYMIAFPWTCIFSVVSASCPQGLLDWEHRVLYLSAITLTCNPELLIRSTCYDMPGLCSH